MPADAQTTNPDMNTTPTYFKFGILMTTRPNNSERATSMADPNTTRERRLEIALQYFRGVATGAMQDLDAMKRAHPPSKRGSRFTHALESLESRLATIEHEAADALDERHSCANKQQYGDAEHHKRRASEIREMLDDWT